MTKMSYSDVGEILSSVSALSVEETSDACQHTSPDYTKYTVKHVTGGQCGDVDEFSGTCGVAVSPDGYIFVADCLNHRVKVYDKNISKCLSTFGTQGTAAGQFNGPSDVAVAPDGKVYVADRDNNRVQVLTMAGHDVTCDVLSGVTLVENCEPSGIAFGKMGILYICESADYRVQVVQQDGTHVRAFDIGSNECEGNVYVTETQDHKILVSDATEGIIKVFDTSGKFIETYPKDGAPGTISHMLPCCLATDRVGNIIIADGSNRRLVILNKDGGFVCTMDTGATVAYPYGVAVAGDGNIIVTDCYNQAIVMLTAP